MLIRISNWIRHNLTLTIVVFVFLMVGARVFVVSRLSTNAVKQAPEVVQVSEADKLIEAIGKLIVLPSDEIPTIATVSDPETLKSQAFFAKAKKGDKVLIYTKTQKAILYDPVLNKIIEVAPINLTGSALNSVKE